MNYLFIGYTNYSKDFADHILEMSDNDNIYVYSDEPIYELQKGINFVRPDTFKNEPPDFVYISMPSYSRNAWFDVSSTWGCKLVSILDRPKC